MGNKDIREQFTPLDLRVADWVSQNYGLTVDEVLILAKLGVKPEQLVETKPEKRGDKQK